MFLINVLLRCRYDVVMKIVLRCRYNVDISKGIDPAKSNNSKECMVCYFKSVDYHCIIHDILMLFIC